MIEHPAVSDQGVTVNRNEDRSGLGDAEGAIDVARGLFEERLTAARAGVHIPGRSEKAIEARRAIAMANARSLNVEEQVRLIRKDEETRWTEITKVKDRHIADLWTRAGTGTPPRQDVGWFWWAETSAWLPADRIGLSYYWDTGGGGVRFTGQMTRDDGDLWKSELGIHARFGLGSDRLPPPGRYISAPVGTFSGLIMGANGVNGPFSFGDNWTKVWLGLVQTLRDPYGAVIAEAVSVPPALIFLESDGDFNVVGLPGQVAFPPIVVWLQPGVALTAELTIKLGFQLEGDSLFRFGDLGGLVPALTHTPQWSLVPFP